MKVILSSAITLAFNTLLPNHPVEPIDTNSMRSWKLHNNSKYVYNVYLFLEKINRLDVLARHFDSSYPDDVIRNRKFFYLNGIPGDDFSQGYDRKLGRYVHQDTTLDQELNLLVSLNPHIWDEVKEQKFTWNKQKIYDFKVVTEIEI